MTKLVTRAVAERLLDRFESAVIDHEDLGSIPVFADDPDEQRAIDRERRIRKSNYTRTRNRILKEFEADDRGKESGP